MARRLAQIVAITSTVLAVALVVLWIRSYWCADLIARKCAGPHDDRLLLCSNRGRILLQFAAIDTRIVPWGFHTVPAVQSRVQDSLPAVLFHDDWPATTRVGFPGLRIRVGDVGCGVEGWDMRVSDGLVAAVLLLPSIPWCLPSLRRRRVRGLCLRCGYDLRGSPGACPECGAARNPAPAPPGIRGLPGVIPGLGKPPNAISR